MIWVGFVVGVGVAALACWLLQRQRAPKVEQVRVPVPMHVAEPELSINERIRARILRSD